MKFIKLLSVAIIVSFAFINISAQNTWEDEFIRNTSTDLEYYNFNKAQQLQNEGINIAKNYSDQVKQYSKLGYASNPQQLLDNFNSNMQQISQLQQQNKDANLNHLSNTLDNINSNLNSGNSEGALLSGLGYLGQLSDQNEAKKAAERQKQQLIQQHQQEMSQFYWKAVELNNQAIDGYFMNAANSFSLIDEKYNFAYVEHHNCFALFMKNNFNYSNTYWTQNNCPAPQKKAVIENNLVAKDIQYINTAKRKHKLYKETNNEHFRAAAVKFAGAAATENKKAEYFFLMGEYSKGKNAVVAYTSLLTAKKIAPQYFTGDKQTLFIEVEELLSNEIKQAIDQNNIDYLNQVIQSNLHHAITIAKKPVFIYALEQDKPDIIQIFLNDFAKNKTQEEINSRVNKTILLASLKNAPNCIERFIELGFSIDFTVNDYTPISIAEKANSEKALDVLLKNTSKKDYYDKKFSTSLSYQKKNLFKNCELGNYQEAGKIFENLTDEGIKLNLLAALTDSLFTNPSFINAFNFLPTAVTFIKNDSVLKDHFRAIFLFHFFYGVNTNISEFIRSGIVEFNPNLELSLTDLNDMKNIIVDMKKKITQNLSVYGRFSFKDVFLINQTYYHFFDLGKSTRFVKGFAIWNEQELNDHKTLLESFSIIHNKAFLDLEVKQYMSLNNYITKVKYKSYKYWDDNKLQRGISNKIKDFPTHINTILNDFESNSLLTFAILKRDDNVILALDKKHTIDWNANINGEPAFMLLTKTMNWKVLNIIFQNNKIDYTLTDTLGNTVFHYLAEYFWLSRGLKKSTLLYPNNLLSNLYNSSFDRSILKVKNNEGKTAWSVFVKSRKGGIWAKFHRKNMEEYLKS